MKIAALDHRRHRLGRGMAQMPVPDLDHRGAVTAPHAGRAQHPHPRRIVPGGQRGKQRLRSRQLAGQAVAHPDGQIGRRGLAFAPWVEMGVERRHLPDLGHAQRHLLGQRAQMGGGKLAVRILDQVQELDQQIAPPRTIPQQGPHLGKCCITELPPLGGVAPAPTPRFPHAVVLTRCHLRPCSRLVAWAHPVIPPRGTIDKTRPLSYRMRHDLG